MRQIRNNLGSWAWLILGATGGWLYALEPAPSAPAEARLQELEKRVQSLERAMVEREAQIAELKRQLAEREDPAMIRGPRGLEFRLNPNELETFSRRMDDFMRRNLDGLFEGENEEGREADPFNRFDELWRREGLPASRPRLGIFMEDATDELRERYQNPVPRGVFVISVQANTPAAAAKLMPGDCILAVDERPVGSAAELRALIQAAAPGPHKLSYMRRGQEQSATVELGAARGAEERPGKPEYRREGRWLRAPEGQAGGVRREVELRAGALEFSDDLAGLLKLDEAQKAKMKEILAGQARKLNDEYAAQTAERSGLPRGGAEVKALLERHLGQADRELQGVLTAEQLQLWREQIRQKQGYSIQMRSELRSGGAEEEPGKVLGF